MSSNIDRLESKVNKLEKEVIRISKLYNKTLSYQATDPEVSLNQARKSAEAICKSIYVKNNLYKNGKPVNKLMLKELIENLVRHNLLPQFIVINLSTIHEFGNFGAHDQGLEDDIVTEEKVEPCLMALGTVFNWYVKTYHEIEEKELKDLLIDIRKSSSTIDKEEFGEPQYDIEPHVTKRIFNEEIPSRDPNFIGRENEIASFMKALVNRKAIGIMGFQGMGGMGKSAIAIEICNIFIDGWQTDSPQYPDYLKDILGTKKYFRDGILWIRLERDESLPVVLETMGHQLGIRFSVKEGNVMTSQIRDFISQLDLLLVIDSAEQNKANLGYLLKEFSKYPILVTSRERFPGLRMISIDAMPKEDAVNLFVEYLVRDLLLGEENEIAVLCEKVGYLPLAVKILACRAYEIDRRVSDLIEDFHRKRFEILNVSSLTESEKKNLDVNTCLALSYERLTLEQQRLLTACSMFGYPVSQDNLFSIAEKVRIILSY